MRGAGGAAGAAAATGGGLRVGGEAWGLTRPGACLVWSDGVAAAARGGVLTWWGGMTPLLCLWEPRSGVAAAAKEGMSAQCDGGCQREVRGCQPASSALRCVL